VAIPLKVHYTGKVDDGSIFDTSAGRESLADKDLTFDIQLVEIL
jgi:FKBP-type peptidyl-prolyl cis-trans isomerase